MDTHSSGPEDLLEQAIEGVIGPGIGHGVELLEATNSEEFVDIETLFEEELDELQPIVDKGVGHGVLQRRFLGVKKKRINVIFVHRRFPFPFLWNYDADYSLAGLQSSLVLSQRHHFL